jgi:hypothetical protein
VEFDAGLSRRGQHPLEDADDGLTILLRFYFGGIDEREDDSLHSHLFRKAKQFVKEI